MFVFKWRTSHVEPGGGVGAGVVSNVPLLLPVLVSGDAVICDNYGLFFKKNLQLFGILHFKNNKMNQNKILHQ